MPKSRFDAGSVEISLSAWKIRPDVCVSRPAMQRRSVVLPQPDGPRKQTNSREWISSEMSFSAVNPPNCLVSRSIRKYGAPAAVAADLIMATRATAARRRAGRRAASQLREAPEYDCYLGADLLS